MVGTLTNGSIDQRLTSQRSQHPKGQVWSKFFDDCGGRDAERQCSGGSATWAMRTATQSLRVASDPIETVTHDEPPRPSKGWSRDGPPQTDHPVCASHLHASISRLECVDAGRRAACRSGGLYFGWCGFGERRVLAAVPAASNNLPLARSVVGSPHGVPSYTRGESAGDALALHAAALCGIASLTRVVWCYVRHRHDILHHHDVPDKSRRLARDTLQDTWSGCVSRLANGGLERER